MVLRGLQKTGLLDYPGLLSCTVFTGGCNFRCPFCHNASLVTGGGDILPEEEFFAFLDKRKGLLDGVCVTGGEPCLQKDLPDFLRRIKEKGYRVKLDTNGSYPAMLSLLLTEGLVDYVAMDVKNSPDKYPLTAGKEGVWENVLQSLALLKESGCAYELRTTLVKGHHTVSDMEKIGKEIAGAPLYFLQNFEDSGDILTDGLSGFSREELDTLLSAILPYVPNAKLRGVY